jgi:hypothetical protein
MSTDKEPLRVDSSPNVPMSDGAINRPVFIVGPHRSGTTLLYKILGQHPDVGYLSDADRRLRFSPTLAHYLARIGLLESRPSEAQRLWDRFWTTDDDVMDARQATPEAVRWHRALVRRVLELRGASRFVAKYPRLSLRLDWLDAVFPGSLFLHLQRDWRAVVNSTIRWSSRRRQKSGRWFGVRIPGWAGMQADPVEAVAGRLYRVTTRTLEEAAPRFGDRFISLRYEDLCREPVKSIRSLCERLDLRWTPEFERTVPVTLQSANNKWKEHLTPETIAGIRAQDPSFFAAHEVDA